MTAVVCFCLLIFFETVTLFMLIHVFFLFVLQVFIELNHIKKCNTVRGVFVLEEFGNYIILILGLYLHGSNSNFQFSQLGRSVLLDSHMLSPSFMLVIGGRRVEGQRKQLRRNA